MCAVSLSWIIKVKKSHLQKGETEGTGSCQLSNRGGGALSYPAGQTRGGGEVVDGGGGEVVASDRVESLQMNTKTALIPSIQPDSIYVYKKSED